MESFAQKVSLILLSLFPTYGSFARFANYIEKPG